MKTVFNKDNQGHLTKNYPIFFGDSLGLLDTVNVTNKRIEALKEQQRSNAWYPTEVSMTQDRQDMINVNRDTADLMVLTISWQHLTDSITGRSIGAMLLPHVTNPEAEVMISEWSNIEFVHGEAYSHIVKQTMSDPDQSLLDTYRDLKILARSKNIIKVFDDLYTMPLDLPLREKKKIMAKALCVINVMELCSFMASFCVTFAIAETGVFQGIAETVSLIAKDELLHGHMSYELIKATRDVDGWEDIYEEIKPEVQEIIKSIVQGELDWNAYLFSEGRKVVGLTEDLLDDTVLYFANTVYKILKLDNPFKVVENNPSKFMEHYLDRSLLQFAPQEIQHGSYRQGAVVDDLGGDLDLDFDV